MILNESLLIFYYIFDISIQSEIYLLIKTGFLPQK